MKTAIISGASVQRFDNRAETLNTADNFNGEKILKTAIITGGTSGIGLAAAKIFTAHDFNCVLVGRSRERFDNRAETLNVADNFNGEKF